MKKRITALLLAALCLLTATACRTTKPEADGRPTVVATNFALYDFARSVAGDDCRVEMLIAPGSEAHDYELTLSDTARVADADLLVYVGGEGEDWIGDLLAVMDPQKDNPALLCALDCVTGLEEEMAFGMQTDGEEEEEGAIDEHVWTSLENAALITRGIAEALSDLDPANADGYAARCEAYCTELDLIRTDMEEMMKTAARKTIVVADRFPFRYLAEELGLDYAAAFSGCSSNVEPTLATVNTLIELVKREEIPVIFVTELSDGKTAQAVASETGAEIRTLYAAHNVTKLEFNEGVTYLDLMRRNLASLSHALGAATEGAEVIA